MGTTTFCMSLQPVNKVANAVVERLFILQWWTQTQLIRTLGSLPISIIIIEPKAKPMYQQIANDCLHLHELGRSYYRIARILNVDAKMVAKAINWIRRSQSKRTK